VSFEIAHVAECVQEELKHSLSVGQAVTILFTYFILQTPELIVGVINTIVCITIKKLPSNDWKSYMAHTNATCLSTGTMAPFAGNLNYKGM